MYTVAPFAGAWIEIILYTISQTSISVAPFAGAWIEISMLCESFGVNEVAPFAGAWIEIVCVGALGYLFCRSLRGSVD